MQYLYPSLFSGQPWCPSPALRLVWACVVAVWTIGLAAQPYYFKNYEVTDGLSHNTIHCAAQDDRGFMWFGTKNGLNRFDGYEFRWYQSDSSAAGALGSNFIESLTFAQGRLWVGTDNGLFAGNAQGEPFELVEGTAGQPVLDLAVGADDEVWVVVAQSLRRIDPATLAETGRYTADELLPALRVATTPAGEVYLATDRSLFRYAAATNRFEPLDIVLPTEANYPLQLSALYPLSATSLAVGTVSHGAFLIDLPAGKAVSLSEGKEKQYVRDFLLRDNELWIGTEDGVHLYNLLSGDRQHLNKYAGRPYGLSDNAVYSLFEDRDRGVWIGTYFRGIHYYTSALTGFRKFVPVDGENSVAGMAVREMRTDGAGRLWIGTEDAGLNRYDPESGQFTHYALQGSDESPAVTNIHGILIQDQEVWVGTFQNGLFVLDAETGAVKRHRVAGPESGLRSNFVFSLYRTRGGTTVALTASGLQRYDPVTDRFELLEGFPPEYFYTSLFEDHRGELWAGTYWDGLFRYDPREGRTTTYNTTTADHRLGNDAINGIFEDQEHNLWIPTENGLNKIPSDRGNVVRYGKADGFPSNVFYALRQDDRGKLWISTANGLACYHPESGRVDTYGTENGLPSNQFNYNSALADSDGRMYFGTVKGFVSFDPYDVRFNRQAPPEDLVLSDVHLPAAAPAEAAAVYREAVRTGTLNLPYARSTFSLSFSALDYTSPRLTEYQYQLTGRDGEWVDLGHENQIYFTDFRHGDYALRLRVRGHNSAWSEPLEFLQLSIAPPWWRTGWAYAAYFLSGTALLLLLLYVYHRYNREKAEQRQRHFEHEKEKELYRAKIEFFTNVSHEILTPLTLIQNPVEQALRRTEGDQRLQAILTTVHRNTSRLVNLVRQLLDFRKMEAQNPKLSFVRTDVRALLAETVDRFGDEAQVKNRSVHLDRTGPALFAYVDEEAFRKIAGNLLENALKYGERNVYLILRESGDTVELQVSNDGRTIPPAERENILQPFYRLPAHADRPGTGLGLPLARTLAELHGGKLEVSGGETVGTTFTVTLPLRHADDFELPAPEAMQPSGSTYAASEANPQLTSTLLVVEDDPDLLDYMARELSSNYTVVRARNGAEALEVLEHRSVQLVVSDVKMPRVDGFTLCEAIKGDLRHSHVPVILLTSRTEYAAELTGLARGADAYIAKPFVIEYLDARIRNLLGNRARIVEHFGRSPLAHLQSIAQSPVDEDFTSKLDAVIQENLADPDLNVETLAERMHMSRSTLYRKIKDISGANPNELINLVRLKKAAELLRTRKYKVYEVADMVGYSSATSFGRNFKKQFDVSPGEFAASETGAPHSSAER